MTHNCVVQLVAEAVPHVEGAPCLGGHNRAELPAEISTPEAAAAYLETLSAPPDSHRYDIISYGSPGDAVCFTCFAGGPERCHVA